MIRKERESLNIKCEDWLEFRKILIAQHRSFLAPRFELGKTLSCRATKVLLENDVYILQKSTEMEIIIITDMENYSR